MAFSYEYTQLIQNNNTLNTVSKTDELTTLLNRRGFFDLGQKNIDIAIEMNNKGLVFFIDMDGLKIMNDTYGHDMGDLAIKTQAKVLKQTFRANDIIARLGGDEFVVIAIGMGADTIPKIRKKIEKTSKRPQDAPLKKSGPALTVSGGGILLFRCPGKELLFPG